MGSLADEVFPLVRTRADLHRWGAANDYGHGVHQAAELLRQAAATLPTAEVLGVTQRALASTLRVIARADDSSGIIGAGIKDLLVLHAELANTAVRVSGLQPGPMRTGLRARAYAEDHDRRLADAAAYAGACVTLLSPAGAAHRGTIWAPEADALPA